MPGEGRSSGRSPSQPSPGGRGERIARVDEPGVVGVSAVAGVDGLLQPTAGNEQEGEMHAGTKNDAHCMQCPMKGPLIQLPDVRSEEVAGGTIHLHATRVCENGAVPDRGCSPRDSGADTHRAVPILNSLPKHCSPAVTDRAPTASAHRAPHHVVGSAPACALGRSFLAPGEIRTASIRSLASPDRSRLRCPRPRRSSMRRAGAPTRTFHRRRRRSSSFRCGTPYSVNTSDGTPTVRRYDGATVQWVRKRTGIGNVPRSHCPRRVVSCRAALSGRRGLRGG